MTRTSRVIVQHGAGELALDEYEVTPVTPQSAVLRVVSCGICGSDVSQYHGSNPGLRALGYPLIPGHEPLGLIEEIGDEAARLWNVSEGDLVAVEPLITCGACAECRRGNDMGCTGWAQPRFGYGFIPRSNPWGPTGGFADYMWLHPRTRLHRLSPEVDMRRAALFNPIAAGVHLAVHIPKLMIGDAIVIFGPGQRGLACVAAAKSAGAGLVVVTGLPSDRHKLALASELGADITVEVGTDDVIDVVRDATKGRMADVAVDTSAGANAPLIEAPQVVRPGGTVVMAGMKGGRPVEGLVTDDVIRRSITFIGAFSVATPAYEVGIGMLERSTLPLERILTHEYELADTELAIRTLSGEAGVTGAIGVAVKPSLGG